MANRQKPWGKYFKIKVFAQPEKEVVQLINTADCHR